MASYQTELGRVMRKHRVFWLSTVMLFAVGGSLIGGLLVWILQGHTLALWPDKVSYPDLIAVLLTGISLIVAVLGVAMAVLAVWGYAHFKSVVTKASTIVAVRQAKKAAEEQLLRDLQSGETGARIDNLVSSHLEKVFRNPDAYKSWLESRSKEIARLRELDENE